jgi:asparagine synthase (glutamine-hydrolysing)
MRLLCGLFNLDGAKANERLLRAMVAQMEVPRLRPATSVWQNGPVGLAVLDFSSDPGRSQSLPETPLAAIAADVRLDDAETLRAAVPAAPRQEDALFLAALDHFGTAGLHQLLGDFAFACWKKNEQRLVCGRDVFGVRPLSYVYQPGKLFAFASLPQALYGAGIIEKKIDEEALARWFARGRQADDSLLSGIKRLPPAHFLEVSRGGISITRYWQLDRASIGARRCSAEEAARELRRLVERAVCSRLPNNGATAAHLSGGLDSSCVAVLAARQLREQGRTLHTYSFVDRQRNDVNFADESEFVDAVLQQEGDLAWTPIRPPVRLSMLNGRLEADNVIGLGPEQPENAICEDAEAHGVSVVLSGWGGDEAASFGGKGALTEQLLSGRWRKLAREVSALGRATGVPQIKIWRDGVLSPFWRAALPAPLLALADRIAPKRRPFRDKLAQLLTPTARAHLVHNPTAAYKTAPSARENRWRLSTGAHISERTEAWAQIGAGHGLAFAFPLLDRRVVEFALSLPSELFVRDGYDRRPFRDAMVDVLPPKVRFRRRKNPFYPSRWLDLAESRDDLLEKCARFVGNETARRLIDFDRLRQQIEEFPAPDQVHADMSAGKIPAGVETMVAAIHGLMLAAYVEQHETK